MATGPSVARLRQAADTGNPDNVERAEAEWRNCAQVLGLISRALATASDQMKSAIGGQTGPAVDAAFRKSSESMTRRAEVLTQGAAALNDAGVTLRKAQQVSKDMHDVPQPTPYRATGNPSDEEIQKEADSRRAEQKAAQAYSDQEDLARRTADELDDVYVRTTKVMKSIHGEPDPKRSMDDGGGNAGTRGMSRGDSGGSFGGVSSFHSPSSGHTSTGGGAHAPGGGSVGPGITPHTTHGPEAGNGTGSQQPATPHLPGGHVLGGGAGHGGNGVPGGLTGAVGGGSGSSSGLGGLLPGGALGTGTGVAGATVGALGTGALTSALGQGGLSSLTGGMRGVVPMPSTAQSAVRGIGTTGRTVGSSTLGRPGAASGVAGRGAVRSSGATGARGAAGAAGRSGGRSGAGGRGGAGAAGRNGRRKDDEKQGKRDLFEMDEDWVGEEDVAPGVLG